MAARRDHGEATVYPRRRPLASGDLAGMGTGRATDPQEGVRAHQDRGVAQLRELQRSLDSGVTVPDDRLTVGAFLHRWLAANMPGSISDSTLDNYVDTVRLHLEPVLGRYALTRLTVSDVDALWAAKRADGYSANSV